MVVSTLHNFQKWVSQLLPLENLTGKEEQNSLEILLAITDVQSLISECDLDNAFIEVRIGSLVQRTDGLLVQKMRIPIHQRNYWTSSDLPDNVLRLCFFAVDASSHFSPIPIPIHTLTIPLDKIKWPKTAEDESPLFMDWFALETPPRLEPVTCEKKLDDMLKTALAFGSNCEVPRVRMGLQLNTIPVEQRTPRPIPAPSRAISFAGVPGRRTPRAAGRNFPRVCSDGHQSVFRPEEGRWIKQDERGNERSNIDINQRGPEYFDIGSSWHTGNNQTIFHENNSIGTFPVREEGRSPRLEKPTLYQSGGFNIPSSPNNRTSPTRLRRGPQNPGYLRGQLDLNNARYDDGPVDDNVTKPSIYDPALYEGSVCSSRSLTTASCVGSGSHHYSNGSSVQASPWHARQGSVPSTSFYHHRQYNSRPPSPHHVNRIPTTEELPPPPPPPPPPPGMNNMDGYGSGSYPSYGSDMRPPRSHIPSNSSCSSYHVPSFSQSDGGTTVVVPPAPPEVLHGRRKGPEYKDGPIQLPNGKGMDTPGRYDNVPEELKVSKSALSRIPLEQRLSFPQSHPTNRLEAMKMATQQAVLREHAAQETLKTRGEVEALQSTVANMKKKMDIFSSLSPAGVSHHQL